MEQQSAVVSISIVSHRQGALVAALLPDIVAHCPLPLEVILTLNVPEALPFDVEAYPFPIKMVTNATRRGFGANHNAAFTRAGAPYFCVLNPDIRLEEDVFSPLIKALEDGTIGVAGPLIVNPDGGIEDSARRFPTPVSILRKALSGSQGPDYGVAEDMLYPDWIAGMFMIFRSEVFKAMDGFDEGYFLYYEDVDLCWRMHARQWRAAQLSTVRAIHAARRSSHRNLRYFRWHGASMLRFFAKRALG